MVFEVKVKRETTTSTTYLVHFEDHINLNCNWVVLFFEVQFLHMNDFSQLLKIDFCSHFIGEMQIIRSTPPRIPRISGLKSQILKPTFLS